MNLNPWLKKKLQIIETLAARDTIIDFGNHKGKMLGALPSSYLKMGLKESSCSDSEYWAKLEDDVYKDKNLQRKSFMEVMKA
ncbi:unnamed protein product [Arabidopsis lyrata]|nr:unnamed protein product [Arabidopsis lyrata]